MYIKHHELQWATDIALKGLRGVAGSHHTDIAAVMTGQMTSSEIYNLLIHNLQVQQNFISLRLSFHKVPQSCNMES